MSFTSFCKNRANYVYNRFAGKPGDLLLYTGTIGWILSSAAQISAVVVNDKIPKKQKKFLVPQEAADAVVNIGSFFLFTRAVTSLGECLVKKGKIMSPVLQQKLQTLIKDKVVDAGKLGKLKRNGFDLSKLDQMKEHSIKYDKELSKAYYDMADGVSFISSTIGSIISANIVTPVLRNKFAAYRQHGSSTDKTDIDNKNNLIETNKVILGQNKVNLDSYRSKTSIYPSGGTLKI